MPLHRHLGHGALCAIHQQGVYADGRKKRGMVALQVSDCSRQQSYVAYPAFSR